MILSSLAFGELVVLDLWISYVMWINFALCKFLEGSQILNLLDNLANRNSTKATVSAPASEIIFIIITYHPLNMFHFVDKGCWRRNRRHLLSLCNYSVKISTNVTFCILWYYYHIVRRRSIAYSNWKLPMNFITIGKPTYTKTKNSGAAKLMRESLLSMNAW